MTNSGTIKGIGIVSTELIFDEEEFSIQRQLDFLRSLMVIALLSTLSLSANILNNRVDLSVGATKQLSAFIYLATTALVAVSGVVALFPFFSYRQRNRKVYNFKQVQEIRITRGTNKNTLAIHFMDRTKEIFALKPCKKLDAFISIMEQNGICVKRL